MHVLVIQLTRLGDIIQSIPLLNDIKKKYPESKIDLLINDVFVECRILLKKINIIPISLNELVVNNEVFINRLNKKNYSLVINLNNSPISKEIFSKISCSRKIGFGNDYRLSYSHVTTKENISSLEMIKVEQSKNKEWATFFPSFMKCRNYNSINLVDIFRHFFSDDYHKNSVFVNYHKLPRDNTQRTKSIAIQCGARCIKRQLTYHHLLDIATHYLSKGYKVYLLGVEKEKNITQKISRLFTNDNLVDLVGKTDLKDLVSILSKCEKLYTPDTGTMHLAALLNTPVFALFTGPAYPLETLAYTKNIIVFAPSSEAFPCYPCNEEESCRYNYQCNSFSFNEYFANLDNKKYTKYEINTDEIGQLLSPINEIALLYREFVKKHFLNIKTNNRGKFLYSDNLIINLKRELFLWEKININEIETAILNLNILKPLLYMNCFYNIEHNKESFVKNRKVINSALRFFRGIINERQ